MKRIIAICTLSLLTLSPLAAQKAEKAEKSTTATSTDAALNIVQTGKTLQLQNAPVGEKLEVLSIVGVKIIDKKIESTSPTYTLDIPKGYYIVKIGTTVRKISVK